MTKEELDSRLTQQLQHQKLLEKESLLSGEIEKKEIQYEKYKNLYLMKSTLDEFQKQLDNLSQCFSELDKAIETHNYQALITNPDVPKKDFNVDLSMDKNYVSQKEELDHLREQLEKIEKEKHEALHHLEISLTEIKKIKAELAELSQNEVSPHKATI